MNLHILMHGSLDELYDEIFETEDIETGHLLAAILNLIDKLREIKMKLALVAHLEKQIARNEQRMTELKEMLLAAKKLEEQQNAAVKTKA